MSKPSHTELALTGSDIAVNLVFDNTSVHPMDYEIQVARVGDIKVALAPGVDERAQSALETASLIVAVTDDRTRQMAVDNIGVLKAYANGIEKSRKEVKQPFWDAGQAIDKIAKDKSAPILAEIARVEKLLKGFFAEQERKADEARRLAAEEERKRLAAEQAKLAEEQRLRAEAERRSREAEAAAAAAKNKAQQTAAEVARLQAQLAQAQADKLAAERREEERAAQFRPATTPPPQEPNKTGTRTTYNWEIEVTDWSELYRAFGWRFIKKELDLQALKFFLGTPGVDPEMIPGVKARRVADVRVSAAR